MTQRTKAELATQVSTLLADNTSGDISEADTRSVFTDTADSLVGGPLSAVDNTLPRFDSTTGQLVQGSSLVVDDSDNLTGVVGIAATGAVTTTADKTDYLKYLGIQDVLDYSAGTWTVTRVAQGDYVNRKTAGNDTTIIGIDITEAIRTTADKGLKLNSFDVIFRNITEALDAHTITLDKITYADSVAVTVTSVALTGALGAGLDADPQIDNVVIDTPAFNVTDDTKYVLELTVDAGATSVYDFIGIMLKFSRNDL